MVGYSYLFSMPAYGRNHPPLVDRTNPQRFGRAATVQLTAVPSNYRPKTSRFLVEFRELSRVRSTQSSAFMERAMGIEPTSEAWEASILPLYDARSSSGTAIIHNQATASTHGSFGILQFPA